MNLIERATKRLEDLSRAGVAIPWAAAGLAEGGAPGKPARPGPPPRTVTRRSASVTLDMGKLESAGYLVPSRIQSSLSEEFRHVKRALLHNVERERNSANGRACLIMVTSALAGEGKTFCAVNLALSVALEVDTSVLLVDADVLRPSIPERLGLKVEKGYFDMLADPQIDLSTVMLRTNVPKLSILPAGKVDARSTELLASVAMRSLLAELGNRYPDRVVILDAPPLLLTTAAGWMASRVGQIVMVVEASRTPRRSVMQAYAAVKQCPLVLSVLNKCTLSKDMRRYGYSYG